MTEINYLTISVDKLKNMEPETLRKYAEEKSATILLDIESAIKAIDEFSSHTSSQSELKGIENVKNFFSFGNTKRNKDLEALKQDFAQSHDDISKIMYKLILLVQESVKFTCTSVDLAEFMHSAIAVMMASGFKDRDGNFHKLDEKTKKFASHIKSEAEKFVLTQRKYESDINDLKEIEVDQDLRIDENKVELDRHSKLIAAHTEKDIEQDNRLLEEEAKTKAQGEELSKQAKVDRDHEKRLDAGDEKDKLQDEELRRQLNKDIEHDARLDNLEQKLLDMEKQINKLIIENDRFRKQLHNSRSRKKR